MNTTESTATARQTAVMKNGLKNGGPPFERNSDRDGDPRPFRHEIEEPSLALMELVSQGVIVMNADGLVISCNDRFTTLTGLPAFVLLDSTLEPCFSPRDVIAYRALLIAEEACDCHGELALRHVDGSSIPVRISVSAFAGADGVKRYVGAAFTDLREERASRERSLVQGERLTYEIQRRRAADERMGRALLFSEAASWECDLGSGKVIHAVGVHRVLGSPASGRWSRQALIDAFVPSDRQTVTAAFVAAGTTGSIDIEGRIATPDGACRWIRLEGRIRPDTPFALAGFLRDVTAAHESRARLLHAAEMEAVGEIAAGIAHDLKNFLHVIGNNLELLGRRSAGDEKIARLSGSAQRALLRAAKLSQQLLTFSRGQAFQLERLSLGEVLPSIQDLLDRALPESVRLRIEPTDDLWSCTTDLYQLEAALLNLSINARDAMPDGGVLSIAVENRRVDAVRAASWGVAEGDYVMISVSDTGTGMAPEVATHAFEPFFTTKSPGKGTGLGLSQVYAFAKRSSGFATIETALGQGSRVFLFLPRSE